MKPVCFTLDKASAGLFEATKNGRFRGEDTITAELPMWERWPTLGKNETRILRTFTAE